MRRARDRAPARARWRRSGSATCTRCRCPTSAASRCTAAWSPPTSSRGTCRSCDRPGDQVFRDAGVVVLAGRADLRCSGVLDDLFELDALIKLLGQILAAGFLSPTRSVSTTSGCRAAGRSRSTPASAALATVFLVVGTVNAVNFVDGLDGLAAGVVGIGAVGVLPLLLPLADLNSETLAITAALLCAALAGACAGFLPHNIHPARDVHGRLGLDAHRACARRLGAHPDRPVPAGSARERQRVAVVEPGCRSLLPIVLPLAILIVPFADLVLAVVRRTRAGSRRSPPTSSTSTTGCVEIGHSHRRAVLIMWVWAALVAFGGVAGQPVPAQHHLGHPGRGAGDRRGSDLRATGHPAAAPGTKPDDLPDDLPGDLPGETPEEVPLDSAPSGWALRRRRLDRSISPPTRLCASFHKHPEDPFPQGNPVDGATARDEQKRPPS